MQAIILAAGMGKRLGEYTRENTKCMVPVNGVRLIDRLLGQLSGLDLKRVVIVVGYEGQKLIDYIGIRYDEKLNIEFINNPIYDKTNNIYSLSLAKKELCEDDTILLESDLIFDDGLLKLIVSNPLPNLALVSKYESWNDGTMVKLDEDNNIISFITKDAFQYSETDSYFKTVNVYKFSKEFSSSKYVPFLEAYSTAVGNNEYYENVLRILSFLNSHDLKALPITNEKWYEIDDKQDLDIAEALFAEDEDVLKKYYGRFGGYWRFPRLLDYCYLVNPYFPSKKILDEMQANFATLLTSYPSGMKVNSLLASKCWKVKEDYIIPGNGAAELIKYLTENITGKVGVIRPSFEEYPNRLAPEQLVAYIPANADFRYDEADIINYFEGKGLGTLILVNPDNPSGNFISFEGVIKLAGWCRSHGIRLVVDESFVDFSEQWETSSLLQDSILEEYPNLVVVKSISKSYGVPGLRLGILASSDKDLITALKRDVSIWNLNSFAEYFMQILTKHEKDYHKACSKFIEERKDFESKLRTISYFRVMPSQANYFLVEVLAPRKASDIVIRLLKEHNILTRDCSSKKGFDGKQYMRIAVRSHSENGSLIQALKGLKDD